MPLSHDAADRVLIPIKKRRHGGRGVTTFRDADTGELFRTCNICKVVKPLSTYKPAAVDRNFGRSYRCLECNRKRSNELQLHLMRKFGITPAEYRAMFLAQGGLCAVCKTVEGNRRPAVDHDHENGRIRGLLCGNCNRLIGLARDNPDVLEAAARYVRERSAKPR